MKRTTKPTKQPEPPQNEFNVGDVVYYFDRDRKFRPAQIVKVGRRWLVIDEGPIEGKKKVEKSAVRKYDRQKGE